MKITKLEALHVWKDINKRIRDILTCDEEIQELLGKVNYDKLDLIKVNDLVKLHTKIDTHIIKLERSLQKDYLD